MRDSPQTSRTAIDISARFPDASNQKRSRLAVASLARLLPRTMRLNRKDEVASEYRQNYLPALGFIEPCIPTAAKRIPSGPDWVFELNLDGYRLHVRKAGGDQHGMPDFNLIHSKEYDREVSLIAFDLLELKGEDVRPQPLTGRKRRPQFLLTPIREGIELSDHLEGNGADIYRAAWLARS